MLKSTGERDAFDAEIFRDETLRNKNKRNRKTVYSNQIVEANRHLTLFRMIQKEKNNENMIENKTNRRKWSITHRSLT